ncbi:MAG: TauD/TfdA family dioxygenase [Pseudomonadota bacterium]
MTLDIVHSTSIQELPDAPLAALSEHREMVEAKLHEAGALLLRSVVSNAESLAEVSQALGYKKAVLSEESSPRSQVAKDVFTSTDYPAKYPIQLHCEYSYSAAWPMRLLFGCLRAPDLGGQTPVADMRRLLREMDPSVLEVFRNKNVLYRRNYQPDIGVDWRKAFGTDDRAQVDAYCTRHGIKTIWLGDDHLRTEQVGPAIRRHPVTGDEVWFNHAFFFNVRALEPESIRDFMLAEDEETLSTNTYYGDGTPIEAETIDHLRAVLNTCTLASDWRQGDLLLVDNMLMAHGRRPFSGERKVLVYMANTATGEDTGAVQS